MGSITKIGMIINYQYPAVSDGSSTAVFSFYVDNFHISRDSTSTLALDVDVLDFTTSTQPLYLVPREHSMGL